MHLKESKVPLLYIPKEEENECRTKYSEHEKKVLSSNA